MEKIHTTAALAEILGLSRWTVSRVLNGHPGVKAETAKRIHLAMSELGFSPNPLARGLRGGRTMTIGVCFQEVDSPVLASKASMLQQQLRQQGYRAVIELTGNRPKLEEEAIQSFLSLKVDGIVLVGSTLSANSSTIGQLVKRKLPIIAVDPTEPLPVPCVSLDREKALSLEIEHLYGLGHRSFGLLGIDRTVHYGPQRWAGVRGTARRLKLSLKRDFFPMVIPGELDSYDYGWRLGKRLLKMDKPPTALIAINDRVAIGAMKCLQSAGYQVPRDFSIVGFDNMEITAYTTPRLTTIDQQLETLMGKATELLINAISGEQKALVSEKLAPVMILRESTGRPPRR